MLSSLLYLKQKAILHRDIKLGNFFLNGSMQLILGDFGYAAQLGTDRKGLIKGGLLGTVNYCSWETVVRGEYGYGSDLWAAGVALFFLKTGKGPFEGKTIEETLANIKEYRWGDISTQSKISDTKQPPNKADFGRSLSDDWRFLSKFDLKSAIISCESELQLFNDLFTQMLKRCLTQDKAERPAVERLLYRDQDTFVPLFAMVLERHLAEFNERDRARISSRLELLRMLKKEDPYVDGILGGGRRDNGGVREEMLSGWKSDDFEDFNVGGDIKVGVFGQGTYLGSGRGFGVGDLSTKGNVTKKRGSKECGEKQGILDFNMGLLGSRSLDVSPLEICRKLNIRNSKAKEDNGEDSFALGFEAAEKDYFKNTDISKQTSQSRTQKTIDSYENQTNLSGKDDTFKGFEMNNPTEAIQRDVNLSSWKRQDCFEGNSKSTLEHSKESLIDRVGCKYEWLAGKVSQLEREYAALCNGFFKRIQNRFRIETRKMSLRVSPLLRKRGLLETFNMGSNQSEYKRETGRFPTQIQRRCSGKDGTKISTQEDGSEGVDQEIFFELVSKSKEKRLRFSGSQKLTIERTGDHAAPRLTLDLGTKRILVERPSKLTADQRIYQKHQPNEICFGSNINQPESFLKKNRIKRNCQGQTNSKNQQVLKLDFPHIEIGLESVTNQRADFRKLKRKERADVAEGFQDLLGMMRYFKEVLPIISRQVLTQGLEMETDCGVYLEWWKSVNGSSYYLFVSHGQLSDNKILKKLSKTGGFMLRFCRFIDLRKYKFNGDNFVRMDCKIILMDLFVS